jgi:hypothetical protein
MSCHFHADSERMFPIEAHKFRRNACRVLPAGFLPPIAARLP